MTKKAPLSLRHTSSADRPHSSARPYDGKHHQGGKRNQHGAHAQGGGHGGPHGAKGSFGAKDTGYGSKDGAGVGNSAFGAKSSAHGSKKGGKGPAFAGKGAFGAKGGYHGGKSSGFKGKGSGFKGKHQGGHKASSVQEAPAAPRVFTTGKDFNVVPKHTKIAPTATSTEAAAPTLTAAAATAPAQQSTSGAPSAAQNSERHERNERNERNERHEYGVPRHSERSNAAEREDTFAGARLQLQAYARNMQHEAIGTKSRAAAAYIVHAVTSGMSLIEAIPYFTQPLALDARDHAFVQEIVYGTLRHRRKLMHTLNPLFSYKVKEKHRIIPCLLLTALYQLTYMQVPPHAVVAASVSACGACGLKGYTSLVNAILRRFLREGGTLEKTESLAEEYSFPDWLFTRLEQSYSQSDLQKILEQSNEKAPLFVRVENSKISTADYLAQLKNKGIEATGVDFSPCTVRLANPINVSHLPGFNEGLCTVQDLSAQLAAPLLELSENEPLAVLDCCCAPGGKTAHILDLNSHAEVTAIDIDDSRLQQTRSTLERLQRLPEKAPHAAKVHLAVADAQDLSQLQTQFDRILVDAPCSGTGVIRRHPDIKWLRRQSDIPTLCETQQQILEAAWGQLKAGGILLYTTCSILPEENKEQLTAFMQKHADAQVVPIVFKGQEYQHLQRLPGDDGGDGFFYARLRKVAQGL